MNPRRDGRLAVLGLTVSLAVLALASMLWGQREGRPIPSSAVAGASTSVEAPGTAASSGTPVLGAADGPPSPQPVELRVHGVAIRMPVVPKGVRPDGEMALPARPGVLGWYRFGPAPTERGSTVLAGHVDSKRYGIGPLARLREVDVGDRIVVRLADGTVLRYRAVGVRSVGKQSRALESVFASSGPSRLRIITCGGEFDPSRGGYQDNVVLTAVPDKGTAGG